MGYQSPLFQRSASNKRSTSPGRSGGSTRFKGGRGRAPSSKSHQDFRKWESYPCPALTGGCPSLHWQACRDRGTDLWVVEVLWFGYRIPFLRVPPLCKKPIPMVSYYSTSTKGIALEEVALSCRERGGRTSSSSFPGLLWPDVRRLVDFRVVETSDRPLGLQWLRFQDSLQDGDHSIGSSVSLSGRLGGLHRSEGSILASLRHWTVASTCGCGLRQALPVSGSLLRPLHGSQVFTRVLTPTSTILLSLGIRMRRYLDYWLIQSSSREAVLQALSTVLSLCRELRDVMNSEKSNFVPAQRVIYIYRYGPKCPYFQGFSVPGADRQASVSRRRISVLQAAPAS